MAKAKGKKGKGKKKKDDDPNALTEVDKTFYELTIADLNRKLARLRSLTQELEEKNQELVQNNEKLDEDKSDIITFLKRMLQEKTNEINELEERITGLQEIRQNETEQFEIKVADLEQEYKQMHEQLTSENKLLDGKLNSLEEFRSQRDDLMKKFESQEKKMEAQEKRHTREMYEIERKFIISKDKLKKDMEARLLQLSTEFHDASELRIAATTHRVIRENIAVNNELDAMLLTHQKMYKDHQLLKSRDSSLRHEANLYEVERNKALAKVRVQKKIIEKIITKNEFLQADITKYKQFELEIRETKNEMKKYKTASKEFEYKIRLLEQNLHRIKCENSSLQTEVLYLKAENDRLDDILMEGVSCIKESLIVKKDSDISIRSSKRENMLNTLFTLLSKGHERKIRKPSLDTIGSVEETYALGDLGFVPKPVDPRPEARTTRNITSQVGASFEDFLKFGDVTKHFIKKSYVDKDDSDLDLTSEEDEEHIEEEETLEEEKKSILFFDEEEAADEETEGGSKEFDPFADADLDSEGSSTDHEVKKKPSVGGSLGKNKSRSSLKDKDHDHGKTASDHAKSSSEHSKGTSDHGSKATGVHRPSATTTPLETASHAEERPPTIKKSQDAPGGTEG